jgi:hypothetical protein
MRQQQHLPFVSVFAWQAEGVTVAACRRTDRWVGEDEKGRDKNSGDSDTSTSSLGRARPGDHKGPGD